MNFYSKRPNRKNGTTFSEFPFVPAGAELGEECRGCSPPRPNEMTCGFQIQLVFCQKKKLCGFIGVEVEQETSAPPPKKKSWIPPCPGIS